MKNAHPVSKKLITWYKTHQRDLPWRNTEDPYRIWLSEIILQQTQVAQGLSYYLKFTEHFPTVKHLANAPEDLVMRLWQGLGYYSRARNLHTAAKTIETTHGGKFPDTFTGIKSLKGVGDYTAAAVASFAYGLPHAVLDGNVYRVLSRLFNIHTPINSGAGKKEFQMLADMLLDPQQAALHNSAMMEFGALWCRPQNPKCHDCPVREHCLALEKGTVAELPVKAKTVKIRPRYFHYLILNYGNTVYIRKRTQKDIWQNLYEFYLIETDEPAAENIVLTEPSLRKLTGRFRVDAIKTLKKHVLSHQEIFGTFYELSLERAPRDPDLLAVKRDELKHYALPQLLIKYLAGA